MEQRQLLWGRWARRLALALVLCAALPGAGCAFGSRALERSYGPYNESLRHVNEEELLRSLVHLRYNETPARLNVSSIDAQYELSGQAEARPFFIAPNPSNSNIVFKTFTSILPDVFVSGANRPTIGLTPGDDAETVRRFMTPITAETLTFLFQTGWPVSHILDIWAERLNGVPNLGAVAPATTPDVDATRFRRVIQLFQSAVDRELLSVQVDEEIKEFSSPMPATSVTAAAAVEAQKEGLELRLAPDGKSWSLIKREKQLFVHVTPGAEQDPDLVEAESLLNLIPGQRKFRLVVSPGRTPDPLLHPGAPSSELRITPRSTAQVFMYLARHVCVPAQHVACGIAKPNLDHDAPEGGGNLLKIMNAAGHKAPSNSYAGIRYRGWWFYIDDRDSRSKATFSLILELSRLDLRKRPPGGGPLLTLPAGR